MTKKKYEHPVPDAQTIKNIRKYWLLSLLCLSDIEFQKVTWLDKNNTNPHWSYVEFISCYFDDASGAEYKKMIASGFFTEREYKIIEVFHEALEKYKAPNGDEYNHEAILNDPKWQKVVALGKQAMAELKAIIRDPDEIKLFESYLNPFPDDDFPRALATEGQKED